MSTTLPPILEFYLKGDVQLMAPRKKEVIPELTPGELAVLKAEEAAKTREAAREAIPSHVMVKKYRVLVDGIVAGDEQQALGIAILKDLVTRADIENAGADFEWLLKIGAIEDTEFYQ